MITWVGYLLLGMAAGVAYLILLRWNTIRYARRGGLSGCAGLSVLRLAFLTCLLVPVALRGATPLLLTSLGLLIAHAFAVRPLASTL